MFLDDDGHFRGREPGLVARRDTHRLRAHRPGGALGNRPSSDRPPGASASIPQGVSLQCRREDDRDRSGPRGGADVWDVATGASIASVDARRGEEDPNDTVALSPDGRTLAVGGWTSVVRLIDVRTGKLLHELDLAGRGRSRSSSPQTAEPSPSRAGRTWRPFGMLLPVPRSVRGSRPAAAGRRSTYPPTVCVS